jgi:hypothetical protein
VFFFQKSLKILKPRGVSTFRRVNLPSFLVRSVRRSRTAQSAGSNRIGISPFYTLRNSVIFQGFQIARLKKIRWIKSKSYDVVILHIHSGRVLYSDTLSKRNYKRSRDEIFCGRRSSVNGLNEQLVSLAVSKPPFKNCFHIVIWKMLSCKPICQAFMCSCMTSAVYEFCALNG